MVSYKCPNCGRIYNYGAEISGIINCMNCRYPLKKVEDVKEVRHPELNEHKVIGTISNSSTLTVECPYCHSTKTKKISGSGRWLSTGLFGLGSSKIGKQWHCNSCKSNF